MFQNNNLNKPNKAVPLISSRFEHNQPNGEKAQNCATIAQVSDDIKWLFLWNDVECKNKYVFACEREHSSL